MLAYGARFELTPRERGMPGAIERARELGFAYDTGERYLSIDGFLPA